ncbi:hypothetical protein H0242_12660 [Bacillus thuringiensis serovar sumiyoshiensis]|uniref:hypothetical protein n=1 Tax=Bacillus thuringiensis TaxID=1428 RepID=UPI000A3C48F9|nr:hypothetical protein [Bacillus thuringiensis]OTW89474.1 hypothetical protein BK710_08160 [Bacillus thuringiensis serovar sumiyoshiensis]
MFFAATLIDIYDINDDYYITCTIDNHSAFNFTISKDKVYGTPFIGAHVSGHYDDNKEITNIFIE